MSFRYPTTELGSRARKLLGRIGFAGFVSLPFIMLFVSWIGPEVVKTILIAYFISILLGLFFSDD